MNENTDNNTSAADAMRLKILLPTEIFLDQRVKEVIAESPGGSFGLLPRHIDFVTVLVPGLLSFIDTGDREEFMAVDEGVLVKQGRKVMVSTRNAARGPDLGELRGRVKRQFETLDERERKARSAVAKLEADFVRQFLKMKERA